MKIGIDARLYGTKHGGIGRYTAELIKNLELIDQENDYFVFLAANNFEEYQPKNERFKKVLADFKVYGISEQIQYPFLLYKYKLDLVHFTHFNAPLLYAKKYIITIHDLIISHYPTSRATTLNPFLYKLKLIGYDFLVKAVAKQADKIIAVSQFTKIDIVKLLKVKPEKISVIYEGVDLPTASSVDSEKVLGELGIKKEFLMYVGSAYPHKNLEKLIEAFDLLKNDYSDLQLVLVGKKNFFYDRLIKWTKEKFGESDKIIFTDYLSDEKIVALYESAKLYVFPSLIEGFGLPPLEAQIYGLPVVSSNKTCLPEVLGDSALYFDPENVVDMVEKIKTALTDDNLRAKLISLGHENVKKYSWKKMAKEIFNEYSNL